MDLGDLLGLFYYLVICPVKYLVTAIREGHERRRDRYLREQADRIHEAEEAKRNVE